MTNRRTGDDPAHPSPRIRDMTVEDCEAVSTLRIRSWRHAYAGLVPQSHLDAMDVTVEAARRRDRFADDIGRIAHVVAERDGAVVGWACCGPHRADVRHTGGGEVYAIYVLPEHLSTGAGRALMDEMIARSADRGHRTLCLWVLAENHRARRFYERAGFAADGAEESFDVGGVQVPEVRYARRLSASEAATANRG